MNDYETIDIFDILDPGLEFDSTNWQDMGLLILLIILIIGGLIYVRNELKHGKTKPTRYYNRKTGKVENIDK